MSDRQTAREDKGVQRDREPEQAVPPDGRHTNAFGEERTSDAAHRTRGNGATNDQAMTSMEPPSPDAMTHPRFTSGTKSSGTKSSLCASERPWAQRPGAFACSGANATRDSRTGPRAVVNGNHVPVSQADGHPGMWLDAG